MSITILFKNKYIIKEVQIVAVIKIIQCGLGSMGSLMSTIALEKKDIKLSGAVVRRPELRGTDLGDYLGNEKAKGIKIFSSIAEAARETGAETAMMATGSFLIEEAPFLKEAINAGLNVVSIAEEMAYPRAADNQIAEELNALAIQKNVTILGTGINPGFVLDLLIVTLTGISRSIDNIYSERVNDLSPYGETVMKTQGIGMTPEAFAQGLKEGIVVGHIGFRQSVMMISDALGLNLDDIVEERTPIIAKKVRTGKHITVKPGMVAGCRHTVKGRKNGETLVELVHPQQIQPEAEGQKTWDYIKITGDPAIDLRVEPEMAGGTGTAAIAVNMVPLVTSAAAGIKSMIDLPVPRLAALKSCWEKTNGSH